MCLREGCAYVKGRGREWGRDWEGKEGEGREEIVCLLSGFTCMKSMLAMYGIRFSFCF